MKIINFSYKYDKLSDNIFTTIRGKTWLKKVNTGETIEITCKHKHLFNAIVDEIRYLPIKSMPLHLLKSDIAPFKIKTKKDFIEFLNKFRRFNKIKSKNEFLTIIILKKENR